METILEINDTNDKVEESKFKTREASRAIILDENNKIPILYVSKFEYYKLPGGGIDDGESKEEALKRECQEEVGCEIEIIKEVGKLIEYRKEHSLKQISYCYLGRITSKGEPNFTQKELENGFQIVWVTIEEAISKVKSDIPKDYEGNFIQKRDLTLLEKAKELI